MKKLTTSEKYNARQKKDAIGMLEALIKKVENDDLILDSFGWWNTNVGNHMIFRVVVISRDSDKDSRAFRRFL